MALLAVLAGALLVAFVVLTSGGSHRVSAMFPSASNFVPGLDVRAAGIKVGKVGEIHREGKGVRMELEIADDSVWPLPRGTRVTQRFGGSIGYVSRYVELKPGPEDAPPLPDGGLIPASDTVAPAEIDEALQTFDTQTRRSLRALLARGGEGLDGAEDDLRRVLRRAPALTEEAGALLADLGADPDALDALVVSTDRVVEAADSSSPGVRSLVTGASNTFDAVALEAGNVQAALDRLPGTLRTTRAVLSHADSSLRSVNALAGDLQPSTREVRRLVEPAESTLARLVDVGPDARVTLATARRASPDINTLLARGVPVLNELRGIGRQAPKMLHCVRPYAPEAAGLVTDWAGWVKTVDEKDHLTRALVSALPAPQGSPAVDSKDISDRVPGLVYAYPRPAGFNAGQPWFMPECSTGREALDPAKDPESARNMGDGR